MSTSTLIGRLREEQRRAQALRPHEHLLAEALALGDEAVEAFARAEGCGRAEARRRLRSARQRGRSPSRVLGEP